MGEAFVHKLTGIAILFVAVKSCGENRQTVGFSADKAFSNTVKGVALEVSVFVFAYAVKLAPAALQGGFQTLDVYVSAYTVTGNTGKQTAFIFFAVCIVANIVNVIIKEGIFRGLFKKILEKRYSFLLATFIAACLFGVWHIIAPITSCFDGTISLGGCMANAAMLAVTSGLVGFKYAMLTTLTGSLYMAMGDHLINNTIVNILHVVSNTGADEWMAVRISVAQTTSFILVLIWYIAAQRKRRLRKAQRLYEKR